MNMRVVAIVPMRHDSERVPGKNFRMFNGRPLFHHIVETLLAVPQVDEVIVDTDSPLIAKGVSANFPDRVRVVPRPEHLRAGDIPMNDVLLNTIRHCEAKWYLQTHSTNPLLRAPTISRALADLGAHLPDKDSLFTVCRMQTRLWWSATSAVNHVPGTLLRTQDLPPIYEENSNMYVFSEDSLRLSRNRIGRAPLMFEIDRLEAWDIDDEADFLIGEFLHAKRGVTV
ncbi:MAG: acylneuraminate cytidylyltransferase family protein [Actinomycetota bacterium]|nr:acylneuraminate cytidylyltransferase family protein [Actinomycetota bacterium]